MGEIARALGTPVEFTYKDTVYRLSPWNYGIIGEFEVYLQDQALRTLKRMSKYLTDEQFALAASKTRQEIDTGLYTFGSDVVSQALRCPQHFIYLTMLCLRPDHPHLKFEEVREIVKGFGPEQIEEKMMEANSDPTKTPPQS